MKAPLRIVFLGCGFITGVHSRHLRRLRHLFIPGYASRDRGKAEAFEREYGGRGVYGDYASAIADPSVDGVVIPEFLFAGDPYLKDGQPGSVMQVRRGSDGVWRGNRDIVLP